jgi:3-hydroxybutyryl-CoA dehydrogenase
MGTAPGAGERTPRLAGQDCGVKIERAAVVGGGVMGAGIAEVCARHGIEVQLVEVTAVLADAARGRVERSMTRAVERGKMAEDERDAARSRINVSTDLAAGGNADILIEAVSENLDLKRDLFRRLDSVVPAHAILATNTSALPVIEIARATARPEQVLGTHFFNPPPVMKLLELVRTVVTSDATLQAARELGAQVGKSVIVAQDRGGFIVNALLVPYLNNAIRMLEAGQATREDIDTGMRLGCNHPMGPLELLDQIGLDTAKFVCDVMYEEYAEPIYAAPPLLKRLVAAGFLGRKNGRGFYTYEGPGGPRSA